MTQISAFQSQKNLPFVFQVSAALKKFQQQNSGTSVADFSIGTPPSFAKIRDMQQEILFGENFDASALTNDFEKTVYEWFQKVIFNMGKYEPAGGRKEILETYMNKIIGLPKDFRATIVSGGKKKALQLFKKLPKDFSELGGEIAIIEISLEDLKTKETLSEQNNEWKNFLLSSELLEKTSLALFVGPNEIVQAFEALHTSILGTPSAPEQDLYLFFEKEVFGKEIMDFDISNKHLLWKKILVFLKENFLEKIDIFRQEKEFLRKDFSERFLQNFFSNKIEPKGFGMISGNGGGRQALHILEKYLAKKGVKTMFLLRPRWTYENVFTETSLISLPTTQNGEPDFYALEQAFQKQQKNSFALAINSPNNPCGVLYSQHCLKKLLFLCEKYGAFLIDDACYISIIRNQEKNASTLIDVACEMVDAKELSADFLQNIFCAVTASKGLGMAGSRIGGIVYQDSILHDSAGKFFETEYAKETPNLFAFFLGTMLMENQENFQKLLKIINQEIDERVGRVLKIFDQFEIEYQKPAGAFYLVIKVPFLKNKIHDMKQFALDSAEKHGIAFMPMEVFGGEKYELRLSLGGEKSFAELEKQTKMLVTYLVNFQKH